MHKSVVEYWDNDVLLEGYIAYNDKGQSQMPAIMIAPSFRGRDHFVCEKAEMLAKHNYVGFALDMYGKGKLGKDHEESAALMKPFIDNRALLRQRILAAYHFLQSSDVVDNTQIAVMGYCFGGLCALDLARSGADLKGAISFHGLLHAPKDLSNQPMIAKILALHGHDDPMVDPMQVQNFEKEMTDANVDWQIHIYGGVMHAFTNPQANDPDLGTVYNSVADQRSTIALHHFLNEIFQR